MSVIVLDNKRIILKGINRYELNSDELYHRNDTEEERFLFIFLINQDELWSNYSFKFLYIEMFDGKSYKFFSDKNLYNLIKNIDYFFNENGIGSGVEDYEEIFEEDEYLCQAVESYKRIKDTYIFVNEDISIIANRLDNIFGTI